MKSLQLFVPLFLFGASAALADTIVYDSLSTGSKVYGHGSYSFDNINDGDAALGTYNGGSPAFEFIPSGITNGDVLSGIKAGIGNDEFTGVSNFHLTLFTSGTSEQLDPSLWTNLGSWGAQTDGQFNSGEGGTPSLISVPAEGVTLINGDHYYLMATVDANQGINGSGNNDLDWGDTDIPLGYAWEPMLNGYHNQPLQFASTGIFQVFVGEETTVPEPSAPWAMCGLILASGAGLAARRRRASRAGHGRI